MDYGAGRAKGAVQALLLVFCLTLFCTMLACGGGSNSPVGSAAGSPGGTGSGSGSGTGGAGTSGSGGTPGGSIPPVQHFAIVVLENANYTDIVGSPNAPYINSLIAKGGVASNYYANLHPSIGNYFIMTTGLPYSVDDAFSGVVPIDNVVRELNAASKSWKVYAEALPSSGYLGGDVYPYLRRHNPFSFFSDVQAPSMQNLNIVNFTQWATDLSSNQLPSYSFIIPDAEHDAHDCPGGGGNCDLGTRVAAADTWLSTNIPQLLTNPQFQQSGILVITTDESADDDMYGGGKVATVIVGTQVKPAYVGTGYYDHRSLLGLSMTALGVPTIPNGAGTANQMTEFFQ